MRVSGNLSKRVATIRAARVTAGRGRRLVIVVPRAVIGLQAMVNVDRTRRVVMRRVVRAAIVVRALPLVTVALRAVTGLRAMANAVRTPHVAMRRAVRAPIAAPGPPSATALPRVATAPRATANAVHSNPAMTRAVRAAIARPAHRLVTVVTVEHRASATTRTTAARVRLPPTVNGPRATALT